MISRLIGGFVSILIGVSLIGPLSTEVSTAGSSTYAVNTTTCSAEAAGSASYPECQLYLAASWGATVLNLVPGFFALGILGIGIAVTYGSLRDAGVV
jgi:hypothetical protein